MIPSPPRKWVCDRQNKIARGTNSGSSKLVNTVAPVPLKPEADSNSPSATFMGINWPSPSRPR